MLFSK
jgi:hypothetical protein